MGEGWKGERLLGGRDGRTRQTGKSPSDYLRIDVVPPLEDLEEPMVPSRDGRGAAHVEVDVNSMKELVGGIEQSRSSS